MPHAQPVAFAAALFFAAPRAYAAPTAPPSPAPNPAPAPVDLHVQAPAGGGLPALDVRVDLARGVLDANGIETSIPIERASLPPEGAVFVYTQDASTR